MHAHHSPDSWFRFEHMWNCAAATSAQRASYLPPSSFSPGCGAGRPLAGRGGAEGRVGRSPSGLAGGAIPRPSRFDVSGLILGRRRTMTAPRNEGPPFRRLGAQGMYVEYT
jgi:hypothetical protein